MQKYVFYKSYLGDIQYYLDNIKNDNEANGSFKLKYLVKFN